MVVINVHHLYHLTGVSGRSRLLPDNVIEIFLLIFIRGPENDWPVYSSLCLVQSRNIVIKI